MLGRLIVGAFLGVLVGLGLAAALVKGLGIVAPAAVIAYALAAATGALTGLVAGKPIWASGGQIEAGLKAFFGALLAAGALFALRTWVGTTVDLTRFGAGSGPLGELPAAALPLIAGVLGALFGLDNTPDASGEKKSGEKVRVDAGKRRVATDDVADEDEAEAPAQKRARR